MTTIISDDEIKLTPANLNIGPVKGLGYSFSSNAQKTNKGLDIRFAAGAVSIEDDLDNSVVVTLKSRPTIEIKPISQLDGDNNVANGDGKILIDEKYLSPYIDVELHFQIYD